MPGDTTLTVIGNLTGDPELRFTPSGAAVANFTVASTPRTFDRQAGEWKDGEALFLRCTIWRQPAEHAAETLTKGARVIVSGRLTQRSYHTRDGDNRTVMELHVEEIGASLRYASATLTKTSRDNPTRTNTGTTGASGGPGGDDPWGAAPPAPGSSASTGDHEPPF